MRPDLSRKADQKIKIVGVHNAANELLDAIRRLPHGEVRAYAKRPEIAAMYHAIDEVSPMRGHDIRNALRYYSEIFPTLVHDDDQGALL